MASIRSAAASSTCSQLSNTNNRTLPSKRGGHRLAHGLARLLGDAQHRSHRVGHRRRIGDGGQFEKPDAVRKFVGQSRRDFGASRVLPTPPTPVNVTSRCEANRRFDFGDLRIASDEAGRPQVAGSPDSYPVSAAAGIPCAGPAPAVETPFTGLGHRAAVAAPDRADQPR